MARKRRRPSRSTVLAVPNPPAAESLTPTLAVAVAEEASPVVAGEDAPLEPVVAPVEEGQGPLRVLAVVPDTAVLRLIRESIGAFTEAIVDTTPDAGFGFEMAMQRDYQMFFLGVDMPVLGGERLYDFISKAYVNARPIGRRIPAVVYIATSGTGDVLQELTRDARVKGVLTCPLEIARLLRMTEGTLPAKEVGR